MGIRLGSCLFVFALFVTACGEKEPKPKPVGSLAPSAPTDVAAEAGIRSATVTWAAPASDGGAAITSYTVTVYPGEAKHSSTEPRAQLSGLENGTAYTFTVTATNAAGEGPASAPSAPIRTPGLPGAPAELVAVAEPHGARLTWHEPEEGGSPITGYEFDVEPATPAAQFSSAKGVATVKGLANGTTYSFVARAVSAVGTGESSDRSNAIRTPELPGAPGRPLATAGDASATLSWTAPESDGGSPVEGYEVVISPVTASATVDVRGTAAQVDGLANGTSYTFQVRAETAVGQGPPSASSDPVTPLSRASTGRHELALSFDVSAGTTVPVSGISLSLTLPDGVTVETVAGGRQIAESVLRPGAALPGASVVTGAWTPAARQVRLVIAATPTGAWGGEFVKLAVDVEPGAVVTADQLARIGTSLADYKAVGVDSGTRSSVVLSDRVSVVVTPVGN